MDRISVVIPARNAAGSIASTLQSLATESEIIGEIILIDDASEDDTGAVARDAASALHLPIDVARVWYGDAALARNFGIEQASSPWIYFIDADDRHMEGGLRRMLQRGQASDAPDLVIGGCIKNVDGLERRAKQPPRFGAPGRYNAERYLANKIRSIAVGSALLKRSAIGEARFPAGLPYDEDTLFWAQILVRGRAATIGEVVMTYFFSTDRTDSRFSRSPVANFLRWRQGIRKLEELGISRQAIGARRGTIALKIARIHIQLGQFDIAARFLEIARKAPGSPNQRLRVWRYERKLARHRYQPPG